MSRTQRGMSCAVPAHPYRRSTRIDSADVQICYDDRPGSAHAACPDATHAIVLFVQHFIVNDRVSLCAVHGDGA